MTAPTNDYTRENARQILADRDSLMASLTERAEIWRQCLELEYGSDMTTEVSDRRLLSLGVSLGVACLHELLEEAELVMIPREALTDYNYEIPSPDEEDTND